MKIIQVHEPLPEAPIVAIIYGEPGLGKTTLALTARRPLHIDTDRGLRRAGLRSPSIQVSSWADVLAVVSAKAAELADYDTIIIDTIGTAVDWCWAEIAKMYPQYVQPDGSPTIKGYAPLKASMARFVAGLRQLNKDILFIAHEQQSSKEKQVQPKAVGSTQDLIKEVADLVGYYHMTKEGRTLSFTPTEEHWGKDSARIGTVQIPELHPNSTLFADLIARTKEAFAKQSAATAEAMEAVQHYTYLLASVETLDKLSELGATLKDEPKYIQAALRQPYRARLNELEKEVANG